MRDMDVDTAHLSPSDYYSIEEVLDCADIISVHLPLNGDTTLFCSDDFFGRLKKGAVFINSSRGEIVDEQALLRSRSRLDGLIVDVWSGEPCINLDLLSAADIATPHIAGYSMEGKINATAMVLNSFAEHYGIDELKDVVDKKIFLPSGLKDIYTASEYHFNYFESRRKNLAKIFTDLYNVCEDDEKLRKNPGLFESLRANYNFRREFSDELIDFVSL